MTIIKNIQRTPTAALEVKRAGSALSRAQFISGLFREGHLTKARAISAASGGMPAGITASLQAAVLAGSITSGEADTFEIIWAGATEFRRIDGIVGIVQDALSMTDDQVDVLFGIEGAQV